MKRSVDGSGDYMKSRGVGKAPLCDECFCACSKMPSIDVGSSRGLFYVRVFSASVFERFKIGERGQCAANYDPSIDFRGHDRRVQARTIYSATHFVFREDFL